MKSFVVLSVVLAVSCVGTMAAPQIFQGGQLPNPFQSFLNLIPFRPFQVQQDSVPAAPAQLPPLQNPFAQFFQLQPPANGWLQFPNFFPNLFNNPNNQHPVAPVPAEGPTIIIVSRPSAPQQPAVAQQQPAVAQEAAPAEETLSNVDDSEKPSPVADRPNQAAATATAASSANANSSPGAGKWFLSVDR